jgi:hypothetical protein
MPESLIDLAGLQVGAEEFLLETTRQPFWVVDHDGVIRFANPAAISTLTFGGRCCPVLKGERGSYWKTRDRIAG